MGHKKASNLFRVAAATALAASATGAGVIGFSGPAAATPSDCKTSSSYGPPGEFSGVCYAGTGYYRAQAYCGKNTSGTIAVWKFGAWQGVGSGSYTWSHARCDSSYPYLISGWLEKN